MVANVKVERGSAEWWKPFLEFAERLFMDTVLPCLTHWDNGVQCVLQVEDVFGNFHDHEEGLHIVLNVCEAEGSTLAGFAVDIRRLYELVHNEDNYGISFSTEPLFGEPHASVSGQFEGIDVAIVFRATGRLVLWPNETDSFTCDTVLRYRPAPPDWEDTDAQEPG